VVGVTALGELDSRQLPRASLVAGRPRADMATSAAAVMALGELGGATTASSELSSGAMAWRAWWGGGGNLDRRDKLGGRVAALGELGDGE
jgi:hypothetical protein